MIGHRLSRGQCGPLLVRHLALSALALIVMIPLLRAQQAAQAHAPSGAPPAGPQAVPQAAPPPVGPLAPLTTGPPITFSKDVAPIVYRQCTSCHRPGTNAPMSLLTFRDARPYAKAIRDKVLDGAMPPWHADPHVGAFANERRLTDADRKTLVAWANTGSREGDPADLPPAPAYTDAWSIGTPDLVVSMPQEYEVPADGVLEYQWFVAPTNLTADRWIKAMEIRSTGAAVVHHVAVMEMPPEGPQRRQPLIAIDPQYRVPMFRSAPPEGAGGPLLMLGASGTGPHVFREGTGHLLKAGTMVTFQVHYTSTGQATRDRTSIGFVFAKEPPREEIRLSSFANSAFVIPAGAASHRVEAELTFEANAKLWAITPHTHLRGKSFEYALAYPDGRRETILSVPKYDFAWQTEYEFAEPLRIPQGTRLIAAAHFDNSRANRSNPDPGVDVRWGEQTWEEMMFTWLRYSADTPSAR